MGWNRALPAGATTSVAASDNVIRDNWDYLRSAIMQEHADPDANPSAPTQIVHLQGSGRVIVYTGTTVLDSSADVVAAVTQLYHDSRDIGRTVIDRNTTATPGSVWQCVATDTFVEMTRFWSTILGPVGTSWLGNGAASMDPLLHAARHLLLGGDPITGLVMGNIVYKTGAGPVTAAGTLVTHTFDYSGRAGNTLILAYAWTQLLHGFNTGSANQQSSIAQLALQLNDIDKSQILHASGEYTTANHELRTNHSALAAFLIPNSAAQKVDWELKSHVIQGAGNLADLRNFGMVLIDLGAVALTT